MIKHQRIVKGNVTGGEEFNTVFEKNFGPSSNLLEFKPESFEEVKLFESTKHLRLYKSIQKASKNRMPLLVFYYLDNPREDEMIIKFFDIPSLRTPDGKFNILLLKYFCRIEYQIPFDWFTSRISK